MMHLKVVGDAFSLVLSFWEPLFNVAMNRCMFPTGAADKVTEKNSVWQTKT